MPRRGAGSRPPASPPRPATATLPGGTTEAAFNDLKANSVFEHLKSAVLAAHTRSQDLGH